MRIEGAKPSNFSGIPLFLLGTSFLLIIVVPRIFDRVWIISLLGWFLLAASWGTSVEVDEGALRLRYAFGKLSLDIPLDEIEELKVVSRLERGTILRETPGVGLLLLGMVLFVVLHLLYSRVSAPDYIYSGDVSILVSGLAVVFLMVTPFGRKGLAILLFGVSLIAGLVLTRYLDMAKSLAFHGVFFPAVFLLVILMEHFEGDYVVIKTPGGRYIVRIEKAENLLNALRGGGWNGA